MSRIGLVDVVCDLKQTDRVTEPYWYEMLR